LIKTRAALSKVVTLFVVVGVIEAIYGILSVFLFTSGVNIGGAHAPYGDLYARGTFLEGNIFGSFEMIVGLLLLSFLFSPHFTGSKSIILIGFVIVLVATVMSFTRAAWIGFLLGSFVYLLFVRQSLIFRVLNYFPLIFVALLLIAGGGYAVSNSLRQGATPLGGAYIDRFQKIIEYESGTGSARLQIWKESMHLWSRNPILGNGTDSIKVLAVGTEIPKFGEDYWIPNSALLALHDTGIVGLLFFSAIQIMFLWNLWRARQRTTSEYHLAVLEGFFAAFVGIQFTYLFTNAFWLIFIWVFMAIGISCAKLVAKNEVIKPGANDNK
jgi:O-antigen ligase